MRNIGLITAVTLAVTACAQAPAAPDPSVAAMEAVRDALKDPESAQFRKVYAFKTFEDDQVCGEVNAKNSMGGYTGFAPFRVTKFGNGNDDMMIASSDSEARFVVLMCGWLKTYSENHGTPGRPATAAEREAMLSAHREFAQQAATRAVQRR